MKGSFKRCNPCTRNLQKNNRTLVQQSTVNAQMTGRKMWGQNPFQRRGCLKPAFHMIPGNRKVVYIALGQFVMANACFMWMLHFRPAILWSSAIHCSCQQSYGNQTYSCNLHWRVLTIIEDCLRLQRCHMFLKHVTVSCSICPVQHVSCCVIDLS